MTINTKKLTINLKIWYSTFSVITMVFVMQVESVDPGSGAVVCQAGVVLDQLDAALAQHGLMVPLDLGAKGSCHFGGNVRY